MTHTDKKLTLSLFGHDQGRYSLSHQLRYLLWHALCWLLLISVTGLSLYGCGGGSGETLTTNVETAGSQARGSTYTGPEAATADVQRFQTNLWANLAGTDRCGACHGTDGQSPQFAHQDDINTAYAEVNGYVDLTNPSNSTLVSKVESGHNCWLESDAACADTIERFIQNWAGGSVNAASNTVTLTAPTIKDAGSSKNFPSNSSDFANTIHPLLTQYCSQCHSDTATVAQSPYLASADADTAYAAAQSKIDLTTPANSRLVLRLSSEFHNCWDDCSSNASTMQSAIEQFSTGIPTTEVDPAFVLSKALTLGDGVVASSGGRNESNVIALWEFKTGEGSIAYDTSGVEPALNLTLSGDVSWVGGWGIRMIDGKAQGSTTASQKLHELITSTGEYSIEAWVAPANVTQEGPARIISYSGGTSVRNFTVGQTLYNYDFLHRSTTTDANGEAALSTADDAEVLQATLQHVVMTFDPENGRRIFVNGSFTGDLDSATAGSMTDWDDTFAFVLGNEVSGDRPWAGTIRLAAIHNRVLSDTQIQENYDVGVGEKFYLLFSVSHLISVPSSYIVFEVSQFDSYSYLFTQPTFITLDSNASIGNITLQGMRLGINGREATVGQAYRHLDTEINDANYTASGQVLSNLGTIIGLEKSPEEDEFFLTFERLGDNTNVVLEPVPATPAAPADGTPVSDIGLRHFAEIHASMSAVTGVSVTDSGVAATYNTIVQQLPTVENIGTFLSAHQMAVTQLAIEYCNALVEDTSLRASYFPGFNFSQSANVAFDTTGRSQIITPLINTMVGQNLDSQPDTADIETELNSLMDKLTSCGSGCASDRTETVVKATCAAVLGSAIVLVQ